ncbi:hypothetical protein RRF57_011225 [Xylaria bambusicola]|uniref:Uncharacterized protein n=1 Tax=Xylaria bambusicola TaxID=326684 RepID=A0AAN7ZDZ9_9PEZI
MDGGGEEPRYGPRIYRQRRVRDRILDELDVVHPPPNDSASHGGKENHPIDEANLLETTLTPTIIGFV